VSQKAGLHGPRRMALARLALTRALGRAARNVALFNARLSGLGALTPTRLTMVPQDLRTADPTVAADIYSGHFVFAGVAVASEGRSPFDLVPPSRGWSETLLGLGWLRHLRAADTALAKANARTLVDDFIRGKRDREDIALATPVATRRLIALLSHAAMIAEGADHSFYERFVKHLAQTARRLKVEMRHGLTDRDQLLASMGCAYAGLCLDRSEGLLKAATRNLGRELDWQILPDGGHVSRNPRLQIDLLLDLLPLRGLYAAKGLEPPRALTGAIDRMMPQLRMFRHGDGTLALFNGMGTTAPDTLATLLAYDDSRARPMSEAPYSGYARIDAGTSLLLADTGAPPDVWNSGEACAAPLAFEFSSGRQRMLVSCGAPLNGPAALREASRYTAAHCTLIIDGHSIGHFVGIGGEMLLMDGAESVTHQHGTDEGSRFIRMTHDGYLASHGVIHERKLSLSNDGSRLTGEDRLAGEGKLAGQSNSAGEGATPVPAMLRFHLHPDIKATLVQDATRVILTVSAQESWIFAASGEPLVIEDSLFMAGPHGPRRTRQISIAFEAVAGTSLVWGMQRIDGTRRTPTQPGNEAPQLF
jgi:uncharacterized heparinase superfamily protein